MENNPYQCFLLIGNETDIDTNLQKLLSSLKIQVGDNNPDYTLISPIKNTISIDEIRNLKKLIFQKPIKNDNKVVVIKNAQKLTVEAQNSLLKILEEPPTHAIIILVSTNKSKILKTITSRVITMDYSNKLSGVVANTQESKTLKEKLISVETIENPETFIDNQIQVNYEALKLAIESGKADQANNLQQNIQLLKESKKMLGANVNKSFTLANFFLNEKTNLK